MEKLHVAALLDSALDLLEVLDRRLVGCGVRLDHRAELTHPLGVAAEGLEAGLRDEGRIVLAVQHEGGSARGRLAVRERPAGRDDRREGEREG